MFKTNLETFKAFVELLLNKQRDEIRDIGAELSDVRRTLWLHSFVPSSYERFHKQKQNTSTNCEGFLSTLAVSVNIWCTNCTAFGTLATYLL